MCKVTDLQDAAALSSAQQPSSGGSTDDYSFADEDTAEVSTATGGAVVQPGSSAQQGGSVAGGAPAAEASAGEAADTQAPLIALRGAAHVRVAVHEAYVELGAVALEYIRALPGVAGGSSINGSSSSSRTVSVPVQVQGTVDTRSVTPPGRPATLTYVARDAAGNSARAERTMEVYDTCAAVQEHRCPDSMQCSVLSACDARLLATADLAAAATMAANGNLSSGSFSVGAAAMVAGSLLTSAAEDVATAATAPDADAALPPTVVVSELELKQQQKDAAAAGGPSQQLYGARRLLPDTAAPTIRLLGEGQLYDTDTGAYGMIHTVFVGEAFSDPGAVAVDLVGTYSGEPAQEVTLDPSLIAVTITAPSGAPATAVRTDVPTGNAAAAGGRGVPYVLSYDVADAAGNRARTVYRRVHVTCRPPEVVCFGSGGAARSCSVAGVCGVGAAADLSLAPAALAVSAPSAAAAASQAAASTAAPTLTLLGSSSVRVRAGLPYNRCQGLDTEGCELGANATATAPGDLAGQVVACADRAAAAGVAAPRPFVLVGLRYCGLDTRLPGRHTVSFHLPLPLGTTLAAAASGSAAATAELVVRRIVVVEEVCDASEKSCSDGRCSTGGVCADVLAGFSAAATASAVASSEAASGSVIGASSAGLLTALEGQLAYIATSGSAVAAASAYVSPLGGANAPPQLQLRAYPPAVLEGQAVAVRRATAYRRCTAGQVPTTQLPCEPGATAWDPEDGNIIQLVALCPPADCAPSQCRAHAVAAKHPADCGVDTTTTPVGATLRLRLAVFDSAGAVAAAERVIRVVSPCGEEGEAAAAQYVCDAPPAGVTITGSTGGGYVCSEVPCEALADLYSGPAAGAASSTAAPRLFLLPAFHQLAVAANSSASGVLAASVPVAVGRGAEANQTLALTYGAPSPVDLAPCVSASALTSASSAAPAGGAQQLGQPQSRPCAAVANSTLEGDLSVFIEVHVEPVCSSGGSDSSVEAAGSVASPSVACGNSCSVAQLSSGACLPGKYRVVYSVEAAGAAGAAAAGEATAAATALQLLVAVEEVRVTRLEELVFVPWAEQLQQQQPAGAAVAATAATNRTVLESLAAAMRLLLASGGGSSTASVGVLRTVTAAMSAALAMLGMSPGAVRGVKLSGNVALLELGPAQQQRINLPANATTLYALRVSAVSVTTAAAAFRPTPAQLLLPPADTATGGRHRRRRAQQAAASATSLAACGVPAPSLPPAPYSSTAAANTSVTATAAATSSGGVIVSLGGLSSACTTPPISWVDYLAAQLADAVEDVDRAASQAAAAAEAAAALAAAQAAAFEGRDAAYEALVGQWAREAAAAQAAAEARAAEALRVLVATLAAQDTVTAAAAAVQSLLQVALTEATESTRLAVLTAEAVWGGISPLTDDNTPTDAANSTAPELNTVNGSHHRRRRLTSAAASDEVFQGYVLAAAARDFDYSLWDVRAVERARHVGSSRNRVLAGLLLHQVRRTAQEVRDRSSSDGALCRRSTHTSLVPRCAAQALATANANTAGATAFVTSSASISSSGDLGGVGIDPHFERRSGMFRPDINASDYYNTSQQRSPELNPTGTPYGFFHLPLPGARHLAPGYPVLLDVRLSAQRAAQALDYLARGAYLSAALTKSLDATLVFYSADAAVFGVWSVSFTWLDSGVIQATARLLGLPAISYGQALSRLDVTAYQRRLLPDLALLLLIACYCLLAGWDAYHTLSAQAQLRRERRQREEQELQQQQEEEEAEGNQREMKLAAGWAAAGDSSGGNVHGKPGTGNGGASAFALAAAQMLARADDGEPGSSELVLEPPPPPPQQQRMVSFTGSGPRAIAEAVEDAAEGASVWGRDQGSVHTTALPEQRDTRRILYGGRPAVDIHENDGRGRRHRHGRWGISRSSAAAAAPKAKAKGGSGGADGPAERGAHYRAHMSVLWLCYEAAVCGLMAAALGVFFTYAIRLSVKDDFTAGGDVYDADTFSPARFFLLKRREPQASALANGTATAAAPAPGEAGRWRLPADASAWEALGAEFGRVDDMYGAVVLYSFLQALVLAMLLVRLLHALSFQPRLSVISGTLARAMPGLAHLFLVATVVVVMLAAAVMVTSGGSRAAQLSSWSAAVTWMYKLVLLGDDEGVFTALLLSATALPAGDRVVTGLVYGLSCFAFQILLGCFVLVLLLAPFYELKRAASGQPGVPQDLARILRWWLQHNLRRAPKNKALACRIDDWLLQPPPAGNARRTWARLLQPLAALRLGKGGGKGGGGGGAAGGAVPAVKAKAIVASGGSGGGDFRPDTPGGSYFTNLAGIKVSTTGEQPAAAGFPSPLLLLKRPPPLLLPAADNVGGGGGGGGSGAQITPASCASITGGGGGSSKRGSSAVSSFLTTSAAAALAAAATIEAGASVGSVRSRRSHSQRSLAMEAAAVVAASGEAAAAAPDIAAGAEAAAAVSRRHVVASGSSAGRRGSLRLQPSGSSKALLARLFSGGEGPATAVGGGAPGVPAGGAAAAAGGGSPRHTSHLLQEMDSVGPASASAAAAAAAPIPGRSSTRSFITAATSQQLQQVEGLRAAAFFSSQGPGDATEDELVSDGTHTDDVTGRGAAAAAAAGGSRLLLHRASSVSQFHTQPQHLHQQLAPPPPLLPPSYSALRHLNLSRLGRRMQGADVADEVVAAAGVVDAAPGGGAAASARDGAASTELEDLPEEVAAAAAAAAAAAEAAALADTVLHNLMLRFGDGGGSKGGAAALLTSPIAMSGGSAAAAAVPTPAGPASPSYASSALPSPAAVARRRGSSVAAAAATGTAFTSTTSSKQLAPAAALSRRAGGGHPTPEAWGLDVPAPAADGGAPLKAPIILSPRAGPTSSAPQTFTPWTDNAFVRMSYAGAGFAPAAVDAAAPGAQQQLLSPQLPRRSGFGGFRRSSAVTAHELQFGTASSGASVGFGGGGGGDVDCHVSRTQPQLVLPASLLLRASSAGLRASSSRSSSQVALSAGGTQAVPGIDSEAPNAAAARQGHALQPAGQRAHALRQMPARAASGPVILQHSYTALRSIAAMAAPLAAAAARAATPTSPLAGTGGAQQPAAGAVAGTAAAAAAAAFSGGSSGGSALGRDAPMAGAVLRLMAARATTDGDYASAATSPSAPTFLRVSQSPLGSQRRIQGTADGAAAAAPHPPPPGSPPHAGQPGGASGGGVGWRSQQQQRQRRLLRPRTMTYEGVPLHQLQQDGDGSSESDGDVGPLSADGHDGLLQPQHQQPLGRRRQQTAEQALVMSRSGLLQRLPPARTSSSPSFAKAPRGSDWRLYVNAAAAAEHAHDGGSGFDSHGADNGVEEEHLHPAAESGAARGGGEGAGPPGGSSAGIRAAAAVAAGISVSRLTRFAQGPWMAAQGPHSGSLGSASGVVAAVGAWAEAEAASAPQPAAASVAARGSAARGALSAGPGPVAEALESKQGCEAAVTAGDASRYAAHTRAVLGLVAALEVMVSELRDAEQQLQVWMAALNRLHVWLLRGGDVGRDLKAMAVLRRAAAAAAAVAAVSSPSGGVRNDTAYISGQSSVSVTGEATTVACTTTTSPAGGTINGQPEPPCAGPASGSAAGGPNSTGGQQQPLSPPLKARSTHSFSRARQPAVAQASAATQQGLSPAVSQRVRGVSSSTHRLSLSSYALPRNQPLLGSPVAAPAAASASCGGIRIMASSGSEGGGASGTGSDDDLELPLQPSPLPARRGDGSLRAAPNRDAATDAAGTAAVASDSSGIAGMRGGGDVAVANIGARDGGGGSGDPHRSVASSPAASAQLALKASRLRQRVYDLTQQQERQQPQPQVDAPDGRQ
ncbi:hypothetical protein HXX76_002830 [Chlamydomonas incerta]|uniref:Polycystin cation channel PKD1/PKD2 domain-containing protein n=1 Tax=Chlamydomonas incerta TaxID=51695 RepID=A0A835TC86_CHLIN|nr:hypothetical protein HXX76_002830 [Chlamydomonas incerta]|eukprot:KAG2442749.1 hypothetical protein HXX76_002830 [Chlamydomonas incerta]